MKVFVYGSLMKRYWNHRYLEGQKYCGSGLLHGYEMYHVSSFPGIVKRPGEFVTGEVYQVDQETLVVLDILEAEGRMYIRVEEEILLETQEKIKAYVYVWNRSIIGCEKVINMPWEPVCGG